MTTATGCFAAEVCSCSYSRAGEPSTFSCFKCKRSPTIEARKEEEGRGRGRQIRHCRGKAEMRQCLHLALYWTSCETLLQMKRPSAYATNKKWEANVLIFVCISYNWAAFKRQALIRMLHVVHSVHTICTQFWLVKVMGAGVRELLLQGYVLIGWGHRRARIFTAGLCLNSENLIPQLI